MLSTSVAIVLARTQTQGQCLLNIVGDLQPLAMTCLPVGPNQHTLGPSLRKLPPAHH